MAASVWPESAIVSEEAARLIYTWRLDPATGQASLHTALPDFSTFFQTFQSDYFSCYGLLPFFVRKDNERCAFVRFRPYDRSDTRPFIRGAEISIVVDPNKRRQGIGLAALSLAAQLALQSGVHVLYAMIRPENIPSKRLFEKAGYSFVEHRTVSVDSLVGRMTVDVDVYSLPLLLRAEQQRVFLVAEIGSNWQIGTRNERKELAARLVQAAAEAGFDAVKFQTFRADKVYAPCAGGSDYLAGHGIRNDIHTLFRDLEMPYEDIPYLAQLAREAGLFFMSTPFSPDDFDAVDPYVHHHKIASYEIAHRPLLEKAAASGKPVFVSTGASYMAEIAFAVSVLQQAGCRDITLLQCTASYPASPSSMNIRVMLSLSSAFSLPVGLSDHSLDCVAAPLLAVAYGARVIEKHVTWKRSLPGPDSFFSIEPQEMKLFVEKVRLAEAMAGAGQKVVLHEEEELFSFAKRSVQAIRPITKGERLKEGVHMDILRPGKNIKGAHPALYPMISGKKACRDIPSGAGIQAEDVE